VRKYPPICTERYRGFWSASAAHNWSIWRVAI